MELTITKNNVVEVFERLVVGLIRAENYNNNCFGMTEIKRARAMNHVVDTVIDKTIEAGYCPHKLLGPTLEKYGDSLEIAEDAGLKKEADEDFRIDMSNYAQAMNYSSHVFESTIKAINEGLMTNR